MSEALKVVQAGRLLRVTRCREDCGVTDTMAATLSEAPLGAH